MKLVITQQTEDLAVQRVLCDTCAAAELKMRPIVWQNESVRDIGDADHECEACAAGEPIVSSAIPVPDERRHRRLSPRWVVGSVVAVLSLAALVIYRALRESR